MKNNKFRPRIVLGFISILIFGACLDELEMETLHEDGNKIIETAVRILH